MLSLSLSIYPNFTLSISLSLQLSLPPPLSLSPPLFPPSLSLFSITGCMREWLTMSGTPDSSLDTLENKFRTLHLSEGQILHSLTEPILKAILPGSVGIKLKTCIGKTLKNFQAVQFLLVFDFWCDFAMENSFGFSMTLHRRFPEGMCPKTKQQLVLVGQINMTCLHWKDFVIIMV